MVHDLLEMGILQSSRPGGDRTQFRQLKRRKIGSVVELNLAAFAESSTLAALARVIDEIRKAGMATDVARLIRVPRETPLPLSFFQERIWDFSQTPEGSAGYTMASSHRISGPLDADLLGECMSYIAKRHEILRTTFAIVDGRPVQVIHPPAPVPLPFLDLAGTTDPPNVMRYGLHR